ncbi:MAG TPA: GNAT family N-acetyltransferase [Candidatus Desulfaltia sp.]|nr:GNAT family N-acetyltransferase [Candidatus Desulfaltia sp.]
MIVTKPMEDFEVRFVDDGDVSEIVELLDHVFRGWPRFDLKCSQVEHWAWKHRDNPVNRSVVLTSTSGGKVIGVNHSLFYAVRLLGSDVLCVMGSDLAVHPDYRRMGVRTVMRIGSSSALCPWG